MRTSLVAPLATAAALLAAGAAHAGTQVSIGIHVPLPGVVVSGGGYYPAPAPVIYAPPPPVYVPAPRRAVREVYYAPPPPPQVVYVPAYGSRWDDRRGPGWERHHDRHDHHHDRHGPHRGR